MLKKIIISFLIMTILLTGSLLFSFIYFERTQKLIIHSLNLKETINHILEDSGCMDKAKIKRGIFLTIRILIFNEEI